MATWWMSMAKNLLSSLAILVFDGGSTMTKAIYTRTQLEPEMGAVKAQNFMMAQAMHAYSNGKRVCRVFSGEGKHRVLEQVIVSSGVN